MNSRSDGVEGASRAAGTVTIRDAVPGDARALSALARHSKAHWGYEAAFMEAARAELTYAPEALASRAGAIAVSEGAPLGFYLLGSPGDGVIELDALYVEPAWIGTGLGRRLWDHAVARAARLGMTTMEIVSDPFAERFYLRMGARRVGARPSESIPGRILPLLVSDLQPPLAPG